MNVIEIEQAISDLASQAFDLREFPFSFGLALGKKNTLELYTRMTASKKDAS